MHAWILAAALLASPAEQAGEHPLEIAQRARAAEAAERWAEASSLWADVAEKNPASPSAHLFAACSFARSGDAAAALRHLEAVVELGVRFDPEDPSLESLRGDARFERLSGRMRARTAPLVRGTVAFHLPKDFTPENVAYDPKTGAFYAGSMYKAKIVRIAPDGTRSDFVPSRRDGLLSVLGMKVDAERRELWAAAGNFGDRPPMENADPPSLGRGALFRFDLDSGALIRSYAAVEGPENEPVQFNDVVIAPGGDVYATAGPRGIWRVRRGAREPEPFFARPFMFFNGIAITPDGRTLFAASHFDGVVRIDVETGAHRIIDVPPGVTLGGIDGLYVHGGSLVAVQNGTDPIRVIRAWLDPSMTRVVRFAVLEQEHPESDIPLTGTIVGDALYYVARSQLRAFEGMEIWPEERLKEPTVVRLPLEIAGAAPPDLEAERRALLAMHRGEIRAHVERDAAWIASTHGDEFVSATRGAIYRSTSAETQAFFTKLFEGATYPEYADLEPPVVRISDDGSMGWVMSRMRVRRVKDGEETSFVYAGIMVYAKRGGQWVRVANGSTFE